MPFLFSLHFKTGNCENKFWFRRWLCEINLWVEIEVRGLQGEAARLQEEVMVARMWRVERNVNGDIARLVEGN